MINWFEIIKRFYDAGLWTLEMVKEGVRTGAITAAEYETITGQVYEGDGE